MPPTLLVGISDAGLLLGVSENTVRRLIEEGQLASMMLSNRRMISRASIQKYVVDNCKRTYA